MDDIDVLARDFGFRPSGKSSPMRSDGGEHATTGRSSSSPFVDDHSHGGDDMLFNDVFGGPPKYTNSNSNNSSSTSGLDYDSIFKSSTMTESRNKSTSSLPVYDKPVYDDDIFDVLPGLKSKATSTSARFDDDMFASMASPPKPEQIHDFDDLFENLGKTEKSGKLDQKTNIKMSVDFDDLLPGFGTANSARNERPIPVSNHPPETGGNLNQTASNVMDDPFGVLESTSAPGLFSDPLEEINKLSKSGNTKVDSSFSVGVFDDLDPLNTFGKATSVLSFNINDKEKYVSLKEGSSARAFAGNEAVKKSSSRYSENPSHKASIDNSHESHQLFDIPNMSTDLQRSFGENASPSSEKSNLNATNPWADMSPRSSEQVETSDDVWLTVSDIPLFTQPTRAPQPSRSPPPIPRYSSISEIGYFASRARNKGNEFSSAASHMHLSQSPVSVHPAATSSVVSSIDKLEDFVMDRSSSMDENTIFHSGEEANANSAAAAAMKEAMDRAEAKFRHAKEVREREYAKATRSKESVQLERDEEVRETKEREREKQERLEHEQRQREEEERRKILERERESAKETERENARRVVERATKEARERAAAEARMKAERAVVEKANTEARERAERAAVQRAQAEARERAAAEARERAERAAAEARERMNGEAREKEAREKAAVASAEAEARRRAERATVEKAASEARERAAAEARERSAAAAARNQQKNDNDLESFFSMGSQASSAHRPGTNFSDPVSDLKSHRRGEPEGAKRTFSSNTKKSSSPMNIVDDLSFIFGAAPSSGEFQEVEGESEERRRTRLERHQRTQERAAKALAEKNQRDLQTHREQEERNRIAEALDIEIKRWAAGKEGNLRALLSTLQYVLWPECGWQPVSLTDLITGASVKKAYRKATLCIHPDKVQQKGANLQQKYIAEKVFDLLKEAWNKFNSEELF